MTQHRAIIWQEKLLKPFDRNKIRKYYKLHIHQSYKDYCKDIYTIIEKDLERTFPYTVFYSQENHKKALEGLLKSYANIHRADNYLQGFNYIMAVLYYVYYDYDPEHALADTWWSFTVLLKDVRHYLPDDNVSTFFNEIKNWKPYFINYIKNKDIRLHTILNPFYGEILPVLQIKWFMTMFCVNFKLTDVVTIFDALILCDKKNINELRATIAANIVLQSNTTIINTYVSSPHDVAMSITGFKAVDPHIIVKNSRENMLKLKLFNF